MPATTLLAVHRRIIHVFQFSRVSKGWGLDVRESTAKGTERERLW